MFRLFLIFLVFLCLQNNAFSLEYLNHQINNNYDIAGLNRAERFVWGRHNTRLSPQARLDLTEKKLFGTTQPGSFNDRVNFINKVISEQSQNNVNNIRKFNRLKYALNGLFNGNITGFTPPVYMPNMYYGQLNGAYYHNTRIPHPYGNGIGNFITQTRVIIDNDN